MPTIDDSQNPAASSSKLNLIQILNTVAFLLKKITGENSWKTPASISLVDLATSLGEPGAKGDKGDPGEPGAKGDDKGDSAPLDHQHALAQVSGLQTALDSKSPTGHQHQIAQVVGLQTAHLW